MDLSVWTPSHGLGSTLHFVSTTHHQDAAPLTVLQYIDQRYDGEFVCDPNSARQTTFGVGILEHAFSCLKPENPMADPVMTIEMTVSTDCAFWVPKGFNVQKTKNSVVGIQTKQTSSLLKTSQENSESFNIHVGVAFKDIHAKVGYKNGKSSSVVDSKCANAVLHF